MARVYVITEAEMQGLFDQLNLQNMIDKNMLLSGLPNNTPEDRQKRFDDLPPDEANRLNGVHRAFHHVCVRWAQDMGFSGGRF